VDWSKVDAALASAMSDAGDSDRFVVFVHLTGPVGSEELLRAGLQPEDQGAIRTASLTAASLERLTEEAWVRRIELSRRVGPAGGD
jgi:hypothetical protein